MTKSNFNPAPELAATLPPDTVGLLRRIGDMAAAMEMEAYLVGGLVRDIFLGVDNVDLDISIVGNGLVFGRLLAKVLGARIILHERFLTATLIVPGEIRIDLATARSERYERPGSLPIVAPGSLEEDLFRRDITINAMAASLMPGCFGEIRDPHGGEKDLEAGLVRILHPASLRDDPTRIMRIIRFAARFGFEIEIVTRACLKNALDEKMLETISADRLRAEVLSALNEPDPGNVFRLMKAKKVMSRVMPGVKFDDEITEQMLRARRITALVAREPEWEPELVGLVLLLHRSSRKAIGVALSGLNFHGRLAEVAGQAWCLDSLRSRTAGLARSSGLHEVLGPIPIEIQIALLATVKESAHCRRLLGYISRGRFIRPELTGKDLKAMGFAAGPPMRAILSALTAAKMDGKLNDKRAEERFVIRNFGVQRCGRKAWSASAAPRRTGNARG